MAGVQSAYTYRTADVVFYYAPYRWCRAAMWLPEGVDDLTNIPVYIHAHGGGWIVTPSLSYMNNQIDRELAPGALSPTDPLLQAGYAVVFMEYPLAAQAISNNRAWPCARYPFIPRAMGRCVQFIKTHAQDGFFNGASLATDASRYVLAGGSAGAIMATWVALQPTGALPFFKDRPQTLDDIFAYRFSHRVGGNVCYEGACEFGKFASDGISAAAIVYFGFSEDYKTSPKFSGVSPEVKRQASTLPLLEANYEENKSVGFYVKFDDGSLGVPSSSLGSGSVLTLSSVSGTPVVGDAVEEFSGTVTAGVGGTVKYWDADTGKLYVERSSIGRFTTTRTARKVGGSGWSGTIDGFAGNDNRLAFLDLEDVELLRTQDTLEIPDLSPPHENIFGAWIWNQLVRNDAANGVPASASKHKFAPADPYIAELYGLSDTYDEIQAASNPVLDWMTQTLGIEVDV